MLKPPKTPRDTIFLMGALHDSMKVPGEFLYQSAVTLRGHDDTTVRAACRGMDRGHRA
jgi:hypothetical protein